MDIQCLLCLEMKKAGQMLSGWGNMELSSAVITLALAHPGIQQLEDGLLDFFGRVGTGEILAQLFAGEDNIIPHGLFLLHHNGKHGVLIQFSALAQFFHPLRLGQ